MASTEARIDPCLIALVLPSIPESARTARCHVRAALGFRGLDAYADDAAIITSELVTNAMQHVPGDGTETIGVTIARTSSPSAVTIIVSDSSPEGPLACAPSTDEEQGRGLQIVEALSAHWGWRPQGGGKAVYAVLTLESRPSLPALSAGRSSPASNAKG